MARTSNDILETLIVGGKPLRLTPSLSDFPEIASLVGDMLCGYGEIDYHLFMVNSSVMADQQQAFQLTFRMRTEAQRIDVFDVVSRKKFIELKKEGLFDCVLNAVKHCKKIRNQYAHCTWSKSDRVLSFMSLGPVAEKSLEDFATTDMKYFTVDGALIKRQHAFFIYTTWCLTMLQQMVQGIETPGLTEAALRPKIGHLPHLYIPEEKPRNQKDKGHRKSKKSPPETK